MNIQINEWNFEVTEVKVRKTKKFGLPFSDNADIKIVNGQVNLEGVQANSFTLEDKTAFEKFVSEILGYDKFTSSRFKNGERIVKINKIKVPK